MAFEKGDRVRVVRDLKGMFPLVKGDEGVVVRHGRVGPGEQTYLWGVLFDRYAPTTHHYVRSPENIKQTVSILEYVELVSAPVASSDQPKQQPIQHEDCINLLLNQGMLYETSSGNIALTESGRFIAEDMIRRSTETHVDYLRILRHSHPDAAKMAILLGAVKNAAAEGGSLEAVEAKLQAIRGAA